MRGVDFMHFNTCCTFKGCLYQAIVSFSNCRLITVSGIASILSVSSEISSQSLHVCILPIYVYI